MPKGQFWSNTFEELEKLGTSTVKQSVKATTQALNPLNALDKDALHDHLGQTEKNILKKNNYTSLDTGKLGQSYQSQDKQEMLSLKNKLFQLVKTGEEKAIYENKQKAMQRKRDEEQVKEQKKAQQKQARHQQDQDVPKGKERRSILSSKKKAQEQHAETKPATGKS